MERTALLVVDVQSGMVDLKPYNIDRVLSNIKYLIDHCREKDTEVIYIQHDGEKGDIIETFTKGWEIHSSIEPTKEEKVIRKIYCSAFKDTELEEYLKSKNIQRLILTGMQTEYCIDTTCRVAFEKGYELIMPEETNTTFDSGKLSAQEIYEHHNIGIFKDRFAKVEPVSVVKSYI